MIDSSTILIVSNVQNTLNQLLPTLLKHDTRVIKNEEDDKTQFQKDEAKRAIKEAYLATNNTKYIILCGSTFRIEAQNSLLKILEEPPKNIIFIIVTESKSSILPTIFSRIPHKIMKEKTTLKECSLDLQRLDLKQINDFLKEHQRINKDDAKEIVQSLLIKTKVQNIHLNEKQLDSFSDAIKLLNLNSRPLNIFTYILLNLLDTTKTRN